MRSLFQNNYESDNDERLDRKFSYNYQVIKRIYPKASELPEEEVRGIIREYYQAPKGQEEQVIKDYISQKEPEWQQLYGLDYEDKEEVEDANSFWQPTQNNDFWGGYGNKQNTSSSTIPQGSNNTQTLGDYFMDNMTDSGYTLQNRLNQAQEGLQSDVSDPFGELKEALIDFEKTHDYPYMDKIGNITTCVGNLDEDFEEFASHPWRIRGTGRLATRQEKWIAYQKLLAAKKPNYRAYYYKNKTNLSIPMDYCKQLLDEGIKSRDSELRKGIPNYDKMSQNMKNALLETHYTSNILPWRHLKDGARGLDQEYLCGELERDTTGRPDLIERNAWAKEQCLKGYFIK